MGFKEKRVLAVDRSMEPEADCECRVEPVGSQGFEWWAGAKTLVGQGGGRAQRVRGDPPTAYAALP